MFLNIISGATTTARLYTRRDRAGEQTECWKI